MISKSGASYYICYGWTIPIWVKLDLSKGLLKFVNKNCKQPCKLYFRNKIIRY